MKKVLFLLFLSLLQQFIQAQEVYQLNSSLEENSKKNINLILDNEKQTDVWQNKVIPTFMVTMGVGIASIWTMDITSGKFKDDGNFFEWKNDGGDYLWTHIMAEYLTAGALVTGGIGLYEKKDWTITFSLVSLGALSYTSLSNLGWTFVEKERYGYAAPMIIGLTGSVISIAILIK